MSIVLPINSRICRKKLRYAGLHIRISFQMHQRNQQCTKKVEWCKNDAPKEYRIKKCVCSHKRTKL